MRELAAVGPGLRLGREIRGPCERGRAVLRADAERWGKAIRELGITMSDA